MAIIKCHTFNFTLTKRYGATDKYISSQLSLDLSIGVEQSTCVYTSNNYPTVIHTKGNAICAHIRAHISMCLAYVRKKGL